MAAPFDCRRTEDLAYSCDPGRRGVEGVAEQAEHPRSAQNPCDLRQGDGLVKPVKCCSYGNGVHARVGKWQLLGSSFERVHLRQAGGEDRPHLIERLHRDHMMSRIE